MDRLRRLDVLFAERVLRYSVAHNLIKHRNISDDGWALTGRTGDDILLPYPRPLPTYTHSLDAAWDGLSHLAKTKLISVDLLETGNGWEAQVGWGTLKIRGECVCEDDANHPAEALVLACLRAVGVNEDELK